MSKCSRPPCFERVKPSSWTAPPLLRSTGPFSVHVYRDEEWIWSQPKSGIYGSWKPTKKALDLLDELLQ